MKEKQIICSECGAVLTKKTAHEFDGQTMCERCFNELTTECDCCHERIWRDDNSGDEDTPLCGACYDYYYTHCESCGGLILRDNACYEEDDDYPYCSNCYERLNSDMIKSYSYKPEPIFYGSGNLFYGVELEIDKGGEYNDNAEILLNIANAANEHLYCKHDGSINNGFEMVSHPMTLDYHTNQMNWLEVFNKAISMGYRSHQTETCGLHIHVSRSAFGKNALEQEDVIARIVHFTELHWNELVKFTRRTESNINHWASRYGVSLTAKDTYKNVKEKNWGRYVAVNLENYNTIEFRIFRGTLRYKTFLATLQLVDMICRLAIMLDDKTFEKMSWSDFVLQIGTDKPELIEYLKSKRLYVNEIQTETEEI